MKTKNKKTQRAKDTGDVQSNEQKNASNRSFPLDIQQHCLTVFKDALWTSNENLAVLQEVKGHLYNRDFAKAFGQADYLRAYALRWSASRALGYAAIFQEVIEECDSSILSPSETSSLRMLSLGGGAGAEVVGLAAWLAHHQRQVEGAPSIARCIIHAVDIAEWSDIVQRLDHGIKRPPILSAYASAAAKANNKALLTSDSFGATFMQADILQWSREDVSAALSGVKLITIMFTLNELYATSVQDTQRLLTLIKDSAHDDTLLLVVDSPGSYSTVSINGSERRYPMHWLLDLIMLGEGRATRESAWAKIMSEESRWFRIPEGLRYPIDLENMRYQVHLYRCPRKAADVAEQRSLSGK